MSPDELRALAKALNHMGLAPCKEAADYLRACADAKPVAWRVECRWTDRSKGGDWRKYADYGTEQSALSSQQVFAKPGDIESRIVPLFTHPAPAAPREDRNVWQQIIPEDAPQAEPKREPLSDDDINKLAWKQNLWTDHMIEFSFLAFAREVERAHGIGGSDE